MLNRLVLAATLALGLAGTALAGDAAVGSLSLENIRARATAPGAPVSGGFMVIKNAGTEADHLVGGSVDFADKVEVHEMVMEGDVMKMRPVEGGIEVPAGGSVELKPGGLHVMFIGLKEQLKVGEARKAKLNFEKAGEVEVEFSVEEIMPGMN